MARANRSFSLRVSRHDNEFLHGSRKISSTFKKWKSRGYNRLEFILLSRTVPSKEKKQEEEEEEKGNTQGKLLASGWRPWYKRVVHVTECRPAARRRRNCRSQIRASVIRGYCARLAWRKAGQAYTLLYLVRGASTSLRGEASLVLIKRAKQLLRRKRFRRRIDVYERIFQTNFKRITIINDGGRYYCSFNGFVSIATGEKKKWYFVTRRENCSRARSMEHVTRICASGRYLRPIKRSS